MRVYCLTVGTWLRQRVQGTDSSLVDRFCPREGGIAAQQKHSCDGDCPEKHDAASKLNKDNTHYIGNEE